MIYGPENPLLWQHVEQKGVWLPEWKSMGKQKDTKLCSVPNKLPPPITPPPPSPPQWELFKRILTLSIKEPKMGESEVLNTVVFLQSGPMRSTPLNNKEAWRTHTDEMPTLGADSEGGWECLGLCYQIVGGIRTGRSSDQEIVQGHEWWDTRARW